MNKQNIFDRMVDNNWMLAMGIVVLVIIYSVGERYMGRKTFVEQFPKISAITDLILIPFAVVVAGGLGRVAARELGILALDKPIQYLTIFLYYLLISWLIARIIEIFIIPRFPRGASKRISGLARGLLYGICVLIGLGVFLGKLGYSFTGIWVSTGVAAAVIGLALQKTLGDLFSGIAISIEQPFELGDWIRLDNGTEGEVIDINWRATRLQGWDNATRVIPNSMIANEAVMNLHDKTHRYSPWYMIKISADVEPRFIKAVLLEAVLGCKHTLKHPSPIVRLADATTVPYSYMVWVHFQNYPAMFRGREELFREIHYALNNIGIQIAPDIQEWRIRKAQNIVAHPPAIKAILRMLDLARDWSNEEIEEVALTSEFLQFDAETVFLQEGETTQVFDVIVSGVIEASIMLPDGIRKVTENLNAGNYFGITPMLTGGAASLTFSAKTDVTVIRINIESMRNLIKTHPERAEKFARIVKQRLDAAEQVKVAFLSYHTPHHRSITEIRQLIERFTRFSRRG